MDAIKITAQNKYPIKTLNQRKKVKNINEVFLFQNMQCNMSNQMVKKFFSSLLEFIHNKGFRLAKPREVSYTHGKLGLNI